MNLKHLFFTVSGIFIFTKMHAQQNEKLVLGDHPMFYATKTDMPIVVDGKMNESIWKNTPSTTLDYFYRVEKPEDEQQTTFRMLWDTEYLYLFYEMKDKFLNAREVNRDGAPYFDDCAEIFLIPAPESLDTHFGFEINIYKASNDFIFFNDYYQNNHVVFHPFNPKFDVEVSYQGTLNDNSDIDQGWTMELAIPLSSFGTFANVVPVKKGAQWAFILVRQDRNEKDGNKRVTSTNFPIYDIAKTTHQPNHFGIVTFK